MPVHAGIFLFSLTVNPFFKVTRNSSAAILSIFVVAFSYLWITLTAEAPAGGQDSWNHFLFARWAPEHPDLLLDQWGKPFFTLLALPFAKYGINGVYVLNFLATIITAWLCYLTARKLNFRNPWMQVFLFGWQPVVFANVHSSLTEPTNAMLLILVCYLFVSRKTAWAIFVASFLPIVRSEGMILVLSILPFILVRGQWKYIPLLFSGTLAFAIFAAFISKEPLYFVYNNPYIHHELYGKFDPGSGSFWHYAQEQRQITGLLISILLIVALILTLDYVWKRLKDKTPHDVGQFMLWLFFPLFISFFLAHSFIWFKGSMGSHGLLRVFVVVAPVASIIAHFALNRIMLFDIQKLNQGIKLALIGLGFIIAVSGANMPFPWQRKATIEGFPGQPQLNLALHFIDSMKLQNHVLVHQLPALNERLQYDPWASLDGVEKAKTFYLWSIDTRPGADWLPDSSVVIWDNFHGRRDAPMPLSTMQSLSQYKQIAYFPSKTDTIFDVRVFLKINRNQ